MTSIRLSFLLALSALPLAGCGSLAAYGSALQQPGAAAAPSANPETSPAGMPNAASAADPTSSSGAPAASETPKGPVSVKIRSSCSKTVKVFFGTKPKFGSGRYSTVSSNSSSSSSFQPGDMFWIVDDSENGLDSATVADGTREIEILSSCTSLAMR